MLPLILISLFLVMAAVDGLLVLQPRALQPLRASWQSWAGAGWIPASWASLFATSVAVACCAVSAAVLATFIRAVQTAPYMWLAPLVVGVCCALIGGSVSALPIPIPPGLFAVISTLMLLGGGALVYYDSLAQRCAGALLLVAPIGLLVADAAQPGASSSAIHALPRVVALLAVAAVAALLLSLANRRVHAPDRSPEQMGERLLELLERAKAGEARAELAERELAGAQVHDGNPAHSMLRLASDEQALELLRPSTLANVLPWAAVGCALVAIAGGYFIGYAPLKQRMTALQHRMEAREAEQGAEIHALRASFADERAALERQLAQAKAPTQPAAEPATGPARATAAQALEPAKEAAPAAQPKPALPAMVTTNKLRAAVEAHSEAPAPSAEPQQTRSVPTHHHAASHHSKTPVQQAKKKTAASDASAKSAPARAHDDDNESINDDPIGGL
jgi:hypothetical protein